MRTIRRLTVSREADPQGGRPPSYVTTDAYWEEADPSVVRQTRVKHYLPAT